MKLNELALIGVAQRQLSAVLRQRMSTRLMSCIPFVRVV